MPDQALLLEAFFDVLAVVAAAGLAEEEFETQEPLVQNTAHLLGHAVEACGGQLDLRDGIGDAADEAAVAPAGAGRGRDFISMEFKTGRLVRQGFSDAIQRLHCRKQLFGGGG